MNSLVCEGRLVAAAVVARLRFSVESVPVTGALESSQDESFTMTACWRYCRDQEQADPCFRNTEESKISQSSKKKKEKNILEEVCEVWALEFWCQTEGQEWFSHDSNRGGMGDGEGGHLFRVDVSAVIVKGREWRLL